MIRFFLLFNNVWKNKIERNDSEYKVLEAVKHFVVSLVVKYFQSIFYDGPEGFLCTSSIYSAYFLKIFASFLNISAHFSKTCVHFLNIAVSVHFLDVSVHFSDIY